MNLWWFAAISQRIRVWCNWVSKSIVEH